MLNILRKQLPSLLYGVLIPALAALPRSGEASPTSPFDEVGAYDYLTKPISKDRLMARVRPHLELLNVHRNLEDLVEEKVSQVKVLSGLLPICSGCKKIRDDEGYWNELELFIDSHSEAEFTHGICPNCIERHHAKRREGSKEAN